MPSAAADCQSSPGNSLGKCPPWWETWWRTRFRWCIEESETRLRRKGVYIRGWGGDRERHRTDRPTDVGGEVVLYNRESEIDNSSGGSSLHLPFPVCQSRRGVIGDAEYAQTVDDRRREFIAACGGWSPSCRPRVRIKAPLSPSSDYALKIED